MGDFAVLVGFTVAVFVGLLGGFVIVSGVGSQPLVVIGTPAEVLVLVGFGEWRQGLAV